MIRSPKFLTQIKMVSHWTFSRMNLLTSEFFPWKTLFWVIILPNGRYPEGRMESYLFFWSWRQLLSKFLTVFKLLRRLNLDGWFIPCQGNQLRLIFFETSSKVPKNFKDFFKIFLNVLNTLCSPLQAFDANFAIWYHKPVRLSLDVIYYNLSNCFICLYLISKK